MPDRPNEPPFNSDECNHRFVIPWHDHEHRCCRWIGHLGDHFCRCGAALGAVTTNAE